MPQLKPFLLAEPEGVDVYCSGFLEAGQQILGSWKEIHGGRVGFAGIGFIIRMTRLVPNRAEHEPALGIVEKARPGSFSIGVFEGLDDRVSELLEELRFAVLSCVDSKTERFY